MCPVSPESCHSLPFRLPRRAAALARSSCNSTGIDVRCEEPQGWGIYVKPVSNACSEGDHLWIGSGLANADVMELDQVSIDRGPRMRFRRHSRMCVSRASDRAAARSRLRVCLGAEGGAVVMRQVPGWGPVGSSLLKDLDADNFRGPALHR
jgi:hypothetical protein